METIAEYEELAIREMGRLSPEDCRRMTAAEKLDYMNRLNNRVREMQLEDLRLEYPDASERELKLRVAALYIDAELMWKAFGWDPNGERKHE